MSLVASTTLSLLLLAPTLVFLLPPKVESVVTSHRVNRSGPLRVRTSSARSRYQGTGPAAAARAAAAASRVRPCYDQNGRPQRCFPPFVNAAFNVPVDATNTCGGEWTSVVDDWHRRRDSENRFDKQQTRLSSDSMSEGRPEPYCQQTEVHVAGVAKSCDVCNRSDPRKAHPPSYLTDFHSIDNLTWWQSSTMLADIQWPNSVNLTLRLGKSFEITYIRLKFHSSRPESFAIYKRTAGGTNRNDVINGGTDDEKDSAGWTPYQFYSSSCEQTYGLPSNPTITPENEASATCRDDFSDISPLSGASVAFSTLEGRPGAYEFESNQALQDWVVANDIKIVLNRINTFRDEVFGDPNVLRSYFYAISDLAVGGRCLCNGHANECYRVSTAIDRPHADPAVPTDYDDVILPGVEMHPDAATQGTYGQRQLACRCEHHTTGPDCDKCLPFYNDRPWRRATAKEAFECQPCNCNGRSDECYFDPSLYESTGHGGHCVNCRENTDGANCDRCRDGFYRHENDDESGTDGVTWKCLPCNCHPEGAESGQCDSRGVCTCKHGVTGDKCDQCLPNYFELGPAGCRTCECLEVGSLDNTAECHAGTGVCRCKDNVEGRNCESCKPGFYGLSGEDPLGCTACFCYGHSAVCSSSENHVVRVIQSDFMFDKEDWKAESRDGIQLPVEHSQSDELIYVATNDVSEETVYFIAPDKYLGNQLFSYNKLLSFSLYLDDDRDVTATIADVILEADNGRQSVSAPIFAQDNPMPSSIVHTFRFRLSENRAHQWTPELNATEFRRLLYNLTAIKLRASYRQQGLGFLDDVTLESAVVPDNDDDGSGESEQVPDDDIRQVANFVEQCVCPPEYVGQFCERCRDGYRRQTENGGPFAACVPCQCHGHSDTCDSETGQCYCQHNTTGVHCDRCLNGFYGFATRGTDADCTECPCPNGGNCVQLLNNEVACLDCPVGHSGLRCERCADGYYDDSEDEETAKCVECACNSNVDGNAVGNCDSSTGECLKCIYNTTGFHCDRCLPGFYGDALILPHGHCLACNCFALGSSSNGDANAPVDCDMSGQCPCLDHVIGTQCDRCDDGYWNIVSGTGCEECNCDVTGAFNSSCDVISGQCYCKPGVGGIKCDQCLPNHYHFTEDGCIDCECDQYGSTELQCDLITGQCPCQPGLLGRQCNRCEENKYDISAGCLDCPECYKEVGNQVSGVRREIGKLREIVELIKTRPPETINDTSFTDQLSEVTNAAIKLWNDSIGHGDNPETVDQYRALVLVVEDITLTLHDVILVEQGVDSISRRAADQASRADGVLDRLDARLGEIEQMLDTEGLEALRAAVEAQERAGQQSDRLTDIARESRLAVDAQETDAATINETASRALMTSQEALELAHTSFTESTYSVNLVNALQERLEEVNRQYNETLALANQSHTRAGLSYQETLNALAGAESLRLSTVNISQFDEQSAAVKDQAAQIRRNADDFINSNDQLVHTVSERVNNSKLSLETARDQRNTTEGLLVDARNAHQTASKAISEAERVLSEAERTLNTLQEFDDVVRLSRQNAEEAIEKIPDIEADVHKAENSTQAALQALGEAENDAAEAERLAILAEEITTALLQRAKEQHQKVNETSIKIAELELKSVEELEEQIVEIETRLTMLEQIAEQDSIAIQETLEKAGEAQAAAELSNQTVADTLAKLNEIMEKLEHVSPIDMIAIDKLEDSLDSAERMLSETDIDGRYSRLEKTASDVTTWVLDYTTQLDAISADVEIVAAINRTIPRTCFKKLDLEPRELTPSTVSASQT